MNYYNEFDPYAAQWLRNLILAGHIPPGDVDDRSIKDVQPDDLRRYTQCHFFAGIGGWSLALRLAGWGADRPVWTGSCPCQPFSAAGKQRGEADERHLWPEMFRLIDACRPVVVFGEQVSSAIRHGWIDGVFADLEGAGYACGAVVLGAHSVGAPHIRQRLFWLADAGHQQSRRPANAGEAQGGRTLGDAHACECDDDGNCPVCGTDFAECGCPGPTQDGYEYRDGPDGLLARWVGHAELPRLERLSGHGDDGDQPGRLDEDARGHAGEAGRELDAWSDAEWLQCTDGKARRTQSGVFPLAHGVSARVGRLRAYGNAIVPQAAAAFLTAFLECRR